MDILWFAVKVTFRLLVAFLKATYWMFQKALPWARRQGENFSQQVNLSRYPFPFGNLSVEMTTLWFLLAVISGLIFSGRMQNNVVPALFLGLIVLPLFLGFGQGVRKPPVSDDQIPRFNPDERLGLAEEEGAPSPSQLPTFTSLQAVMPVPALATATLSGPPLEHETLHTAAPTQLAVVSASVSDTSLPTFTSLEPVPNSALAHLPTATISEEATSITSATEASEPLRTTAPVSVKDRFTTEEWQELMEAPELIIYAVMRLGERTGPLQLIQEIGAGALALTKANDSPFELIREASQWRDFGAIEGEHPEVLPDVALSHCRRIIVTLSANAVADEAQAFTIWLLELARVVASAASEQGIGGPKLSPQEEAFLTELALALGQASRAP